MYGMSLFSVRLSLGDFPFVFFTFFKTFQTFPLGVGLRVRLSFALGLGFKVGFRFIFCIYFVSAKPVAASILEAK